VESRTKLVNHVRGIAKSLGHRIPRCSAKSLHRQLEHLPSPIKEILAPVMETIATLTSKIGVFEARIQDSARAPTPLPQQVNGVGPLTSLCFLLTIEEPRRFEKGRQVGAYLGLVPRRDQTGVRDPELRITKIADRMMRTLLIQCAHYIIGHFGHDSDLRRFELRLASRGGKNARKRAIVAVTRKLAVLLRSLWITGAVYEPLRNNPAKEPITARA